MNKTEALAYDWLQEEGHKDIIHQKNRSPDFLTSKGNYEVKRAYMTRYDKAKILMSTNSQLNTLIKEEAYILVWDENLTHPFDIIKPSELKILEKERVVRDVILHIPNATKERVSWSISIEVLRRLRALHKEKYPDLSESAVATMLLREALPTSISVVG